MSKRDNILALREAYVAGKMSSYPIWSSTNEAVRQATQDAKANADSLYPFPSKTVQTSIPGNNGGYYRLMPWGDLEFSTTGEIYSYCVSKTIVDACHNLMSLPRYTEVEEIPNAFTG